MNFVVAYATISKAWQRLGVSIGFGSYAPAVILLRAVTDQMTFPQCLHSYFCALKTLRVPLSRKKTLHIIQTLCEIFFKK
jgi:hypothetical protein